MISWTSKCSFLDYIKEKEKNILWVTEDDFSEDDFYEENPSGLYYYKRNTGKGAKDNSRAYFISDAYPQVEELTLIERDLSHCLINVEYSLSNHKKSRKRPYECYVLMSLKDNTIESIDRTFIDEVQRRKVRLGVGHENNFKAVCKRYFEYVINSENISFISRRIEWRAEDGKMEFIPLTSNGGWTNTDESIFNFLNFNDNGIIYRAESYPLKDKDRYSDIYHKHTKEEIIRMSDSFKLSLCCLKNNPSMIGIFSYTVYSILLNYIYSYDRLGLKYRKKNETSSIYPSIMQEFAFSINIYGKDISKVRCIANVFSNIYYVDMLKNPSVRGQPYMSASSLRTQFKKVLAYRSIPVIVTNKTPLKKSSSIVKRLFLDKEQGNVHIFPVYLSTSPMNVDEILDFNIGVFDTQMPDKEILFEIKDEISFLLLRFIWYLSEISEGWTYFEHPERQGAWYTYDRLFWTVCDEFEWRGFDMQENACKILLYAAFSGFCEYLKRDLSLEKDAGELLKRAESFFFEANLGDNGVESLSSFQTQNDSETLRSFGKYIKNLFSNEERDSPFLHYIKKDTGKNYDGECYFLDFNAFFKGFQKFNNDSIPVAEERLKSLLKQKGVLVVRNNGKQTSMQRRVDGKLVNLLIIKKDLFDTLIDNL